MHLNPFEQRVLLEYETKYNDKVYQLNQDETKERGIVSSERYLQTIIKNAHLLWVDTAQRWLTAEEMLLAQGFPLSSGIKVVLPDGGIVTDLTPTGRACCSFNVVDTDRVRKEMASQAGNSMNVSVVGVPLVYCIAMCERVENFAGSRLAKMLNFNVDVRPEQEQSESTSAATTRIMEAMTFDAQERGQNADQAQSTGTRNAG